MKLAPPLLSLICTLRLFGTTITVTSNADSGYIGIIQPGCPTLNTDQVSIRPSICGASNGSLTGITYQNTTGTVYLAWEDSAGQAVSNNINLTNVPTGLYRLALKDGGGCDTLFTGWYRIPDEGTITIDTSMLVITGTTCGSSNGTITGITASNATAYTWTIIGGLGSGGGSGNSSGSGSVGGSGNGANSLDLSGLAGGTYQLSFSNIYGCAAQTPGLLVPANSVAAFDYTQLQTIDDTCNSGQGAIRDLKLNPATGSFTWVWLDGSAPAGNTPGYLDSLKAGTYTVTVKDANQCTVISKPFTIADIEYAPPAPQVSDQDIPRNGTATIIVGNPETGTYELLDNTTPGAIILATSTTGVLETPPVSQDETLYVLFIRGDCSSALSPVNIKVFDSVRILVPNAFTPDKGVNDRWRVLTQGRVNSIRIAVYDRFGQQVFAGNSLADSWDGTSGGHRLTGTFVYLITGVDYYNKPFRTSGTVIVIR